MPLAGFRLRTAPFGTVDPRFPLLAYRSRPQEDELLLSWVTRLARGNAVKLQTFVTDILGFHSQTLCRDLDRLRDEEFLARLIKRVGCSYEQAFSTGLWAFEGRLWFEALGSGPVDWMMPMGRTHHDRRRVSSYSTQVCCACLASDPIPYFRRFWRLALAVACPIHGIYLRDCCPWCHGPIEFHTTDIGCRLLPETAPLMHCGKCGRDWCHEVWDEQDAPSELVAFQRQLCHLLSAGWSAELPGAEIYSPLFFAGLKRLLQLLIQPGRCSRIRDFLALSRGELLIEPPIQNPRRFEALRVGDRSRVLDSARELLDNWPNEFVSVARACRVSSSYIFSYRHPLPYWLHAPVQAMLFDKDYSPTKQERNAAKNYLLRNGGTGSKDEVNGLLGVSSVLYARSQRDRWNPRGPNARFKSAVLNPVRPAD
ncbi:TniQ family protein [Pseudomonas aeruginosa]|uniref:TniQ family protein n=1 Tax=Pseudomonas aeruginosa TaxID=287 RepID=UPI0039658172